MSTAAELARQIDFTPGDLSEFILLMEDRDHREAAIKSIYGTPAIQAMEPPTQDFYQDVIFYGTSRLRAALSVYFKTFIPGKAGKEGSDYDAREARWFVQMRGEVNVCLGYLGLAHAAGIPVMCPPALTAFTAIMARGVEPHRLYTSSLFYSLIHDISDELTAPVVHYRDAWWEESPTGDLDITGVWWGTSFRRTASHVELWRSQLKAEPRNLSAFADPGQHRLFMKKRMIHLRTQVDRTLNLFEENHNEIEDQLRNLLKLERLYSSLSGL